ncbi:TPA: DUF1819 family protein [Pseudomonas putida]|nr:DUF1819 family protein [Pseudomonas sp. CFA]HEN8704801.1 DUF1819 family protein [Pseudomonas putida]
MSAGRSYTTQLQAGLALIEETRLLLGLYEPGMSTSELSDKALASGLFPLVSARRLHNIVSECFAPRFLRTAGTADVLKRLACSLTRQEFSQLLFLHTARANLILDEFVRGQYWPHYSAGRDSLTSDEAREFVLTGVREGKTRKPWSNTTIKRVSSYLIGCCTDYELLSSNARGPRRILPFRILPKVAVYLAYDLKFQGLGDNQIVGHCDWQLFGLEREDVREEFKRLSLRGFLIMQSAAEVTSISWTHKHMDEVIDVLTQS